MSDLRELLSRARAAFKVGEAREAVRLFAAAQALAPRDPEIPHERGLALLEAGEVGLAARAQGEALALDPDHVGARAQRAAARRLIGGLPSRLARSPLIGTALSRDPADPLRFSAPFAELRAVARDGLLARLDLVFQSMDASLARSDLSYGGSTEDEHGRRVPLDEFSAAAIVFLGESLGIEPLRARRLLSFLLTPECGMGPHRFAGVQVGWTIAADDGERRYGLVCLA